MDEAAIAEPTAPTEQAPIPPAQAAPDPFALDEASFASLSPEQRASLEPVIDGWKKRAIEQVEKAKKSVEENYAPVKEKALALENLTKTPQFQQWWHSLQQNASQGQSPQAQRQIQQSRPQDFATPEEWQAAVLDASNGDPAKMAEINQRMFTALATPLVQRYDATMRELNTRQEMRELMENYPDYKELDQIGLNDKGEGTSLLEHCLNWAEASGKSLEEGYRMARNWANSIGSKEQAKAMGIVTDKKATVTTGPTNSTGSQTLVYVDNQDELIKKSMEAALDGRKDIRFALKQPGK